MYINIVSHHQGHIKKMSCQQKDLIMASHRYTIGTKKIKRTKN